jgi:uncharacterized membrane protein YphA (DoxX/SURF4 family)
MVAPAMTTMTWKRLSVPRTRLAHLAVANLRILLGFAFLPAGLKKVLGEPFTDPANTGAFHEFLHAFHATGWFYGFVGAVQLLAAGLLLTQRHAQAGALIALPVLAAITAFCWSTKVYPTASVVTLMLAGNLALIAWHRAEPPPPARAPIAWHLWERCGAAILILYLAATAAAGEVYRPEGVELDTASFYLLPALALLPAFTWLLDHRTRHRSQASRPGAAPPRDSQ